MWKYCYFGVDNLKNVIYNFKGFRKCNSQMFKKQMWSSLRGSAPFKKVEELTITAPYVK